MYSFTMIGRHETKGDPIVSRDSLNRAQDEIERAGQDNVLVMGSYCHTGHPEELRSGIQVSL